MKVPVYNCEIEDSVNSITGVYAISFVELPANEVDFVALNKETPTHLNKDEKKHILTGVVLKPDQLIYRYSKELGEYYIKFSAEQIERISQKMMRLGVALYNTTHQHQKPLSGNYLTELWIVENPENDKSNALGFKNLPKGTLMCSYKIKDNAYWDNEVMTGNVNGFSLEGIFNQELNMSKITNKSTSMKKKKFNFNSVKRGALLLAGLTREELNDLENIEVEDATASGEPYVEFTLKDGKIVKVDDTGFATLDDVQCPAGEHLLADGNILVIDESGNFVETKEASTAKTDPEESKAAETLKRKQKLGVEKEKQEKQKLEDAKASESVPETTEALKAKIVEMQTTIDELTAKMGEAVSTVEELKKKTPSTKPVVQPVEKVDMSKMSPTERMAYGATLAMERKTKK